MRRDQAGRGGAKRGRAGRGGARRGKAGPGEARWGQAGRSEDLFLLLLRTRRRLRAPRRAARHPAPLAPTHPHPPARAGAGHRPGRVTPLAPRRGRAGGGPGAPAWCRPRGAAARGAEERRAPAGRSRGARRWPPPRPPRREAGPRPPPARRAFARWVPGDASVRAPLPPPRGSAPRAGPRLRGWQVRRGRAWRVAASRRGVTASPGAWERVLRAGGAVGYGLSVLLPPLPPLGQVLSDRCAPTRA